MAVFVSHANKEEYSSGKAATAGALYILFDYLGFICVLALGILVLFRRNNLTWIEIGASTVIVLLAGI
jgi:hypothetical protein